MEEKNNRKSLMHTFLKGILYFFSLNENPIEEYDRRRKEKNDLERMCSDWYNVGNDIRRAYEKYKSAEGTC
jgi:hypothetical protein